MLSWKACPKSRLFATCARYCSQNWGTKSDLLTCIRMREGLFHLVSCGGCLHKFKIWGEKFIWKWLLDNIGMFLVVIFGTGSRLVKWYKAWWGGWVGKVVFPLAIRRANKELAATARNVWRSFAFIDIGAERWASDFFLMNRAAWFHMVSYGFICFHMVSHGFTWPFCDLFVWSPANALDGRALKAQSSRTLRDVLLKHQWTTDSRIHTNGNPKYQQQQGERQRQ